MNFNVSTRAHRDPMDREICTVLVLSECEGGELVLYEYGLVLELRSGDLVCFPSMKVTHFNLDYKGKRASFVFHSDKDYKRWVKGRDGCEGKIGFAGSTDTRELVET